MKKNSFLSGTENKHSWNIKWSADENGLVTGEFTPPKHLLSYPGTLHGGILMALIDDAMGYAINYKEKTVAYTGKMEFRFRKQPKLGEKLIINTQLEKQKKVLYYIKGRISNEQGETCVEANAVFMSPLP